MPVDLKLVIGTVNFTDWLRVSAAKVSDPGTEVFSTYIDVPVTNYTLIIPNLDPDNYYIDFRDAPTNVALGTLVSQAFYNAQTGQFEYERRFYTIGSLPVGVSNDNYVLTDPYLMNKNVTGVFKEAFRFLEPVNEFDYDTTLGTISLLPNGGPMTFSSGEKFIVELKFNNGSSSASSFSGLFSSTIIVTDTVYALIAANKFKRHCLNATSANQLINLCPLSAISSGDFFYFENKRDGLQVQSRLLANGTDKILFNGFNLPGGILISEAWVNQGHSVYIRKEVVASVSYWEIILDYDGTRVGERIPGMLKSSSCWLPEDGTLKDGDVYPGLYWYITNMLPGTHKIIDDAVVNPLYSRPANKPGLFVVHSTLRQFRMPNTQGLSEKNLLDFNTYAGDPTRNYDYPGGQQAQRLMKHRHLNRFKNGKSDQTESGTQDRFFRELIAGGDNYGTIDQFTLDTVFAIGSNTDIGGDFNIVENYGVILLRHI